MQKFKKGELVRFVKAAGKPGFAHPVACLQEGDFGIYKYGFPKDPTGLEMDIHIVYWQRSAKSIGVYDGEFESLKEN